MTALGINDGSVVIIKSRSKKSIISLAYSNKTSCNVSCVQMNRVLRYNLKAYLGQIVIVEKFEKCTPASTVEIAPIAETITGISGDLSSVIDSCGIDFQDFPVFPNFIIPIYALNRTIEFVVTQTEPSTSVQLYNSKQINVSTNSVKRNEDMDEFDKISYDSIGGLDVQIKELRFLIELPLQQPQFFKSFGISPSKGILISGPSGCGKTMIGKAIQNETPLYFERINGIDLLTKTPDEASLILRRLMARAVSRAPSIIFIDDIDLIILDEPGSNSDCESNLHSALVSSLEQVGKRGNVAVIGTSSDASSLPKRLKTVKRFGSIIDISLPGRDKRAQILRSITQSMKVSKKMFEDCLDNEKMKTAADLKEYVQRELINRIEEVALMHKTDKEPIKVEELLSLELGEGLITDEMSNESSNAQGDDPFTPKSSSNQFESDDPFSIPSKKKSNFDDEFSPSITRKAKDPFKTQHTRFMSNSAFVPNKPVSPFGSQLTRNGSDNLFAQSASFSSQGNPVDPFSSESNPSIPTHAHTPSSKHPRHKKAKKDPYAIKK
ncbi:ATPase, AAA family protein [Histomonas meleagridis]|uniref:ATPase, AAA family protein n=1 Tax=Histomonas meleagridis TaxID=135588 RepID=UPI00355A81AE|nr:ATPase, AAA family protein [Histomonas meleagridis]KAH0804572.1 ATPase, AAA family protein [Histomonas meleagridis]